ncbi:MAG TPA: TraR/DksA family transcriptional regulator, partial [Gammaproteobacteria bacterium]|nr:TraR/DksA family transcriptional regulator [Gammaproteobacteria bacterium]
MADFADKAQAAEAFFLATSLADCDRELLVAQATGRCLWCGEPVAD